MAQRPKYKRGFTVQHHFDEWWDRMGEEFKAKLFIGILLLLMVGSGFGLYIWLQGHEKKELMELARIRQEKEAEAIRHKISQRPIPPGHYSPRED